MPVFFFFFPCFLELYPIAYGSFQARDGIGAAAAGLCHSHSNARYELHLLLHHSSQQLSQARIEPESSWILSHNEMSDFRAGLAGLLEGGEFTEGN